MIEVSEGTGKLLALSMLSGVGPATLRRVSQLFGFETRPVEDLATEVPALARAIALPGAWSLALEKAEEQLEMAERKGAYILSPLDIGYPKLLAATKDDPFLLFIRGSLPTNPENSVAIIGTREPTAHGEIITTRITQYFVEQGWSIVSGLAIGCDAIAHRVAVDSGGHTIAVLAHGLQEIVPAKHRDLAEDILVKGGALVSQYPFGREAIPQQFAQRDKTQAGLARGVVMVQSDIEGGSLHASRASLEYGRWLAVPYPTEADRATNAAKIQANLLLAGDHVPRRMELLRLKSEEALARVLVLRGKEDYSRCLGMPIESPETASFSSQGSIF